jgi:hypothetical protein
MQRTEGSQIPGTILPVQFFDRTAASDTPEKRLIFAVLLDAVMQLRRGDTPVAVEAERWIRDEADDVPVSFPQACEALGLEAQNLARGLLAWRAQSGSVPGASPRDFSKMQRRVAPLGRMRRRGVRSMGELAPSSARPRRAAETARARRPPAAVLEESTSRETSCLLCTQPAGIRETRAKPGRPPGEVLCRSCAVLRPEERKPLRDHAMIRMLEPRAFSGRV